MEDNKDKTATTHTRVLVSTIETVRGLKDTLRKSGKKITYQEIYDRAVKQYAKSRTRQLANEQN